MKIVIISLFLYIFGYHSLTAQKPENYSWTSFSKNSSESMPVGGGDIGINAWVESGDLLLYITRSGCYDENNALLKSGRIRIKPGNDVFTDEDSFCQELNLNDGYMTIGDKNGSMNIWVDVFSPVIHIESKTKDLSDFTVT